MLNTSSIDGLVKEAEDRFSVMEVKKGDAILIAQFLYLLGKIFGDDCIGQFPGIYGSESISRMINGGKLTQCLMSSEHSFLLTKENRNFFFLKSSEKLISIMPVKVGQDNDGAFVKNGIYSPLRIAAFSEKALEKSKKFAFAYKNLSGMNVEIIQSYIDESCLKNVDNSCDDSSKKFSGTKIDEVFEINELIEVPDFPCSIDDLVDGGKDFFSNHQNSIGGFIGVLGSLREALSWAEKNNGIIASLPYLIAGLSVAQPGNYLRTNWHTAFSEENVGIDKKGKFVKSGNPVVVVVHGGGILTPERIGKAYSERLTSQGAAKLKDSEFDNLLEGILPTGERISLYTIEDVKNGRGENPFSRYAVVLDFERGKATINDYQDKTSFINNDLVIARAGTLEYLEKYFDNIQFGNKVGSFHRFKEIDPAQSQGRLLYLDSIYGGLHGSNHLGNNGRFVGVAPKAK